jgi:uncharacterized protein
MEIKHLPLSTSEIKFAGAGFGFSGYASMFGGVDAYGDTIQRGAYEKTLQDRDRPIRMRWNHYGDVIGKWKRIEEDEKGLWVEGELTEGHSKASDVYASLRHGAIDGLSIGYRVKGFEEKPNGIRLLKEIELVEISVVEEPADLYATVNEVKSALAKAESLKEIESLLRDVGRFSHADAKLLVSRVKALNHRDDEEEKTKQEIQAVLSKFGLLPT